MYFLLTIALYGVARPAIVSCVTDIYGMCEPTIAVDLVPDGASPGLKNDATMRFICTVRVTFAVLPKACVPVIITNLCPEGLTKYPQYFVCAISVPR